ncbi:response regulator [Pararobbsia silviterrae]|uniref:histidine kinase n=1 Tax=Pararobbsia silviterrae TaxID=1792498 RepID=A0A494Y3C3_9BURK|nr:response regulator [Pararobbsia silviterrae]RKP54822.1 response regulator [Pararobbsia silviterrae]
MTTLHVILVEDSALDAEFTLSALDRGGYHAETTLVDNEAAFTRALDEAIGNDRLDLILADFVLPSFSGTEALAIARARAPDVPFIFVSGVLGEEHAVDMLKRGATDYVLKQRLSRLPAVVARALNERSVRLERIRIERTLHETETHFRLLVDALRDYAVMTLDAHGCVRTWNAASERILGYTSAEVLGQSARIFFSREDIEAGAFERELDEARRVGTSSDDRWLWRKDGKSFFAAGTTTAILSDDLRAGGERTLLGFSKIIRDATQARFAADALRLAKEQAETANRAKDHFLAVLSHELRTPLTPILAAVRLIEMKGPLPDGVNATLDVIRRNVELEARLIDDLLDLTSIARGKLSLNFQAVSLDEVLMSALEMSSADMHAKRLHISTRFEIEGTRVSGDAARLQQIIWNLVRNAVKFTPEGGRVEVTVCRPDPQCVSVVVSDTGIGISAEALPRIFSAFEQADETISKGFGGLGLGLAIASTLAQKHGGTLSAHSEGRGAGARFTLTLPVLLDAGPVDDRAAGEEAAPESSSSLRVLLVEDNAFTSSAMADLLSALGHQVSVADTVHGAIELAGDRPFDLLISDIGLPDGSGLDVMHAWTARQPGVPGVAVTGYGMDEDVRRCRDAGFADHLTKPVNVDRLEAMLRAIARQVATQQSGGRT